MDARNGTIVRMIVIIIMIRLAGQLNMTLAAAAVRLMRFDAGHR